MIPRSEVLVQGYSGDGRKIVYRATHLRTGVFVTKAADPYTHSPERFEANVSELLNTLEREILKRRQVGT